jgi:O-succinylbenzoic acid--CoA ligase
MKLCCPIRDWARAAPGAPALRLGKQRWTYEDLDCEVGRWAALLHSRNVGRASRVALLCENRPEFVFITHAVARLGAALVPLNARLTRGELEPVIERISPDLVIAEEHLRERVPRRAILENLADDAARSDDRQLAASGEMKREHRREADELFAIVFTSGTSGTPKGAELTVGNFAANAQASAQNLGGGADQRWLACLPLYHVGGLAMVTRTARYGAELILHSGFEADAVNASIEADAITHLSLVENALTRMLAAREGKPFTPAPRAALIGGGPVSAELLEQARLARLPVLHTYGLTEATSQVTTERMGAADGRTAGRPLAGIKVRIVDSSGRAMPADEIGEIEVQGPTVMRGYWSDPAGTTRVLQDGWLRTHDLGALDEEGRLRVLARRSDLLVSGGENVYPAEVEYALAAHPNIADVAIVARDDARWGQVPIAAFVARDGTPRSEDLERWCRQRIAAFKVPRRWLVFESLPRNAMGKVDRSAVREMVERALRSEGFSNLEAARRLL